MGKISVKEEMFAPGLGNFASSAVRLHNGGNLNPCHVTHDKKDSKPSDFICPNFLRNQTFMPFFKEEFDLCKSPVSYK